MRRYHYSGLCTRLERNQTFISFRGTGKAYQNNASLVSLHESVTVLSVCWTKICESSAPRDSNHQYKFIYAVCTWVEARVWGTTIACDGLKAWLTAIAIAGIRGWKGSAHSMTGGSVQVMTNQDLYQMQTPCASFLFMSFISLPFNHNIIHISDWDSKLTALIRKIKVRVMHCALVRAHGTEELESGTPVLIDGGYLFSTIISLQMFLLRWDHQVDR